MNALSEFEVLLSVWHTPPSISQGNSCNSPPRRLLDYADFIDRIITEYGKTFTHLELWNEPNNRLKWDFPRYDPDWSKFGEMVGAAAYWAKQRGKQTVLGGIIPVDHHWLEQMRQRGVLQYIDIVAIHAFPGMWFPHHPNWDWQDHWQGWSAKLTYVRQHVPDKPVWVTETGLATWDLCSDGSANMTCSSRCSIRPSLLQPSGFIGTASMIWMRRARPSKASTSMKMNTIWG